jgi:hypothetical protein
MMRQNSLHRACLFTLLLYPMYTNLYVYAYIYILQVYIHMYCYECKPVETCDQCGDSYCEDCKPVTYNEQIQGDYCTDCGEVAMDRFCEIED